MMDLSALGVPDGSEQVLALVYFRVTGFARFPAGWLYVTFQP